MQSRTRIILLALATLAACPKPIPDDPVPADCKKPGQACADPPAPEAPPPIGSNSPPPK